MRVRLEYWKDTKTMFQFKARNKDEVNLPVVYIRKCAFQDEIPPETIWVTVTDEDPG